MSVSPIPYGDPSYLKSPNPHYKPTHYAWQKKIRSFIDKHIIPNATKWDEQEQVPEYIRKLAYKAGVYSPQFPKKYGGQLSDDWDYFHYLIFCDEWARSGGGKRTLALSSACLYREKQGTKTKQNSRRNP